MEVERQAGVKVKVEVRKTVAHEKIENLRNLENLERQENLENLRNKLCL